jgi:trans-aconitate methyltransferase
VKSHVWDPELYEARHNFVWKYGRDLIELLQPKPGEHILDIGCGTGQLTNEIGACGAIVTGLDASPEMVAQARQNYPQHRFLLASVTVMDFEAEFDAVFSNAALHWILDAQTAANRMAQALRRGGRFVAELGGRGNVQIIERAIDATIARYLGDNLPAPRTWYPSIAEYATLLGNAGLEVLTAELYDRPTPLEGADGMANWIRQFKWYYFEALPAEQRSRALAELLEDLAPVLRNREGWFADYRRLRITAIRAEK